MVGVAIHNNKRGVYVEGKNTTIHEVYTLRRGLTHQYTRCSQQMLYYLSALRAFTWCKMVTFRHMLLFVYHVW